MVMKNLHKFGKKSKLDEKCLMGNMFGITSAREI